MWLFYTFNYDSFLRKTDQMHIMSCNTKKKKLIPPAWISNHIHYKVWDEITYPFLNFNGATVEV